MLSKVLVVAATLTSFVVAQTATGPTVPMPTAIPKCIPSCLLRPALSSGCKIDDPNVKACVCTNAGIRTALTTCIPKSCKADETALIFQIANDERACGAVEGFAKLEAQGAAQGPTGAKFRY